jgi:CRISPR-associated protein Cas4
MDADEEIFHAMPQTSGRIVHKAVDNKSSSSLKNEIISSDELGVMGKIDIYRQSEKLLVERKNNLKQIYRALSSSLNSPSL